MVEVAKANYCKLKKLSEHENPMKEAVELVNDIIGYIAYYARVDKERSIDLLARSAFLNALNFIIMPTAYGVLTDLLLGNLPAYFMQLRLIVEASAKALATDYVAEFKEISLYSIEALEQYKVSTSKFLKEILPEVIGKEAANETLKLWSKLSRNWLHFRGIAQKLRERIETYGFPPSYSIVLPIKYDEEDKKDLQELTKRIKETRKLLKISFESWKKLLIKQEGTKC